MTYIILLMEHPLKSSVSDWLEKLCGDRWLSDLQRRRSQLRADLKQFEISLDIRMTDLNGTKIRHI